MNTFSLVLFGWLLYLAIEGKLTDFIKLATTATANASPSAPASGAAG